MWESGKHLTLDFGSGYDLTVHEIEPHVRLLTDSMEPASYSLSLSFSLSVSPLPAPAPLVHVLSLSLSLSQNK